MKGELAEARSVAVDPQVEKRRQAGAPVNQKAVIEMQNADRAST
jgi:hypothetical protein